METLEAIHTRRSVLDFTSQSVPEEQVQILLEAAMQAPSAGNQQPWHFVLITDRKQLDAIADFLPFGKMLHTAPLGVVVCADVEHARYRDYWVQDCSAATMNLLLTAHDLGLGAVWVGVYPLEERVMGLKEVLGLPEQIIPLTIIPIGYPAAKPEPQDKRFDRNRVHTNSW